MHRGNHDGANTSTVTVVGYRVRGYFCKEGTAPFIRLRSAHGRLVMSMLIYDDQVNPVYHRFRWKTPSGGF